MVIWLLLNGHHQNPFLYFSVLSVLSGAFLGGPQSKEKCWGQRSGSKATPPDAGQ